MFTELLPVHPVLLHPRTGAPLRAIGLRPDGTPLWPILGGDGTEDDANNKKGDVDEDEDGDGEDGDGEESGKGKPAPEDDPESIEYWKKRSRQNEREAKKLRRENESIKGAKPAKPAPKETDEDKVDADKIREEAKAEAKREALRDRVSDKIEAKASKFTDPEDAVAILLRSHDIEDFIDGDKIDVDEIVEALKDLGKKKPHLLAQGKKFEGDGDGGARQSKSGRPKNLADAIGRHYSGSK